MGLGGLGMSCQISVHTVIGFHPSGSNQPSRIFVNGAASDCSEVAVTVSRLDQSDTVVNATVTKTANVDSQSGAWQVEFTAAASEFALGDFLCGSGSIEVSVDCTGVSGCRIVPKFPDLPCQAENICPVLQKPQASVPGPGIEFCNPDQTRTVTTTAIVSPAPGSAATVVQWQYFSVDGTSNPIYGPGEPITQNNQQLTDTRDLPEGTYDCYLAVIFPAPCPGQPARIVVPSCAAPDEPTDGDTPVDNVPSCPTVSFDTPIVDPDCTPEGTRMVSLKAEVSPTQGDAIDATFSITNTSTGQTMTNVDQKSGQTAPFYIGADKELAPGSYEGVLDITSHPYCGTGKIEFTVPPCPDDGITVEPGTEPDPLEPVEPTDGNGGGENGGGENGGGNGGGNGNGGTNGGGGGINLCLIAMIVLLAFAVAGAIMFGVSMCLIGIITEGYSTVVLVIVAAVGAILMILASVFLIAWMFICGTCRRNCWLLDLLIDVLLFLAGAGIVLSILGAILGAAGLGKLCFLGWLIDALDFGLLALVAYWFARFVGCRAWPRWVPDWARISLPEELRMICTD
jgi:uncharacterized membrane protein YgcG